MVDCSKAGCSLSLNGTSSKIDLPYRTNLDEEADFCAPGKGGLLIEGSVAFICSFHKDNNKIVNFTRTEANHTEHNSPPSPCLQTQLYYAGAGGGVLVDIKTKDYKTIHVLKWDQRKSFLVLTF
jgi:hypothetical protein